MLTKTFRFSSASTEYYFAENFHKIEEIVDVKNSIVITDENIFKHYSTILGRFRTIVLTPGEESKTQSTVDFIISRLIEMEANRQTILIGIGGGVITDITGYTASIYMRGIRFGFVPTSLLAMVDASIGGKNGVDVGVYKNLVGTIRQPVFLFYDIMFLQTLPDKEWKNGFAEIIKHGCILDKRMFKDLETNNPEKYRSKKKLVFQLIQENAFLKSTIVKEDEFETGNRKLLNFGHTIGHALEKKYNLSHGEAVSIGMAYDAHISANLARFKHKERVLNIIEKYGLPSQQDFNKSEVFEIMKMDKKRNVDSVQYILLKTIGRSVIHTIPFTKLEEIFFAL